MDAQMTLFVDDEARNRREDGYSRRHGASEVNMLSAGGEREKDVGERAFDLAMLPRQVM